MNLFIALLIFIFLLILLWKLLTFKTKSEIEEERRIKESLADEYIYDPETGAKLTLEQAESGHWISHDNKERIINNEEIDKYYESGEKEQQIVVNHIFNLGYSKQKFSDDQISILESLEILSKYDDWNYSNSFYNEHQNIFIFFPIVELLGSFRDLAYIESQLMFWIKLDKLHGHYYFREKTKFEGLIDKVKNNDEIILGNFECFSYINSENKLFTKRLLEPFEPLNNIEIEIYNNNLFVKNLKKPNIEEFNLIYDIIKNVC